MPSSGAKGTEQRAFSTPAYLQHLLQAQVTTAVQGSPIYTLRTRCSRGWAAKGEEPLTWVMGKRGLGGHKCASLTCVLDSHVGQQEVLPEGAVGTKATSEGLVTDVGELVVQQRLLVLTDKLTELTLEPGGSKWEGSSAMGQALHHQGPLQGHTCGWQQPGCVSAGAS